MTEEEKTVFARECEEIEKAGGDVLGYIRDGWPSYSPRACWLRIQREYLGRKVARDPQAERMSDIERDLKRYTAELKKQSRRDKMESRSIIPRDKKKNDTRQAIAALLEAVDEGKDPLEHLREYGYDDPRKALSNMKQFARKWNMQESMERLWRIRPGRTAKELPAEKPEPAAETEPQPDPEPRRPEPTPLCAVSLAGRLLPESRYDAEDGKLWLTWDGEGHRYGIKLPVKEWEQLLLEIDMAIAQLTPAINKGI